VAPTFRKREKGEIGVKGAGQWDDLLRKLGRKLVISSTFQRGDKGAEGKEKKKGRKDAKDRPLPHGSQEAERGRLRKGIPTMKARGRRSQENRDRQSEREKGKPKVKKTKQG